MTADLPEGVAAALADHDAFDRREDGAVLTTTAFDARVTATRPAGDAVAVTVTVRAPTLDGATADEVGDAVASGWRETFERRLADAPTATRADVSLSTCDLAVEGEEIVATLQFAHENATRAVDVAKTMVEYVEGTYVEGVVPGYEYEGVVADLLGAAATGAGDGTVGGTPL